MATREPSSPNWSHAVGRRPSGVRLRSAVALSPMGAHFVHLYEMTHASEGAFRILARDLREFDAPGELVRRAEAAASQKLGHVDLMGKLALRFGGTPVSPEFESHLPQRDLLTIARENVVEGCVRETYGSLVAHWQGAHAKDLYVRDTMRIVAEDERKNSALAFSVHKWIATQILERELHALNNSRMIAIAALRAEVETEPAEVLTVDAGLPHAREAVRLVEGLVHELWV